MISATEKIIAPVVELLHSSPVQNRPDRQILVTGDRLRRHEPGQRKKRIERLGSRPLTIRELEISCRDVVRHDVALDVVERIVSGDM